jgi:UDPglucose--hexose-1-phosphate uridylyltransferase
MHRLELTKPDGRLLTLYSRKPMSAGMSAPSPNGSSRPKLEPELRWHPLRGEWVAYAPYRQDRTFLPPKDSDPLAPQRPDGPPTELPAGDYDIAVFDNLFPTLAGGTRAPGACEVVVFTQDPVLSLGNLALSQLELLLAVWADRTRALAARGIQYVMPFENRGVEMGVTLHHAHGQIYGYPFIPPIAAREQELQRAYLRENGRGLLEAMVANELTAEARLVYRGEGAVAFVPECARYPYEVWVLPRRPVGALDALSDAETADLARALKTVLLKFDALWKRPFPYLMVLHQAPTDGEEHPEAHLHFEFYPALRAPDRMKFLAGTELGAGLYANDSLPEEKARELRAVEVAFENV